MRWLPSRAHDNGMFVVFSNGVGIDDDEVRTGNAMILDPYGRILAETWKADDAMVVADLDASLLEHSTGSRWIKTRRPGALRPADCSDGERDRHAHLEVRRGRGSTPPPRRKARWKRAMNASPSLSEHASRTISTRWRGTSTLPTR